MEMLETVPLLTARRGCRDCPDHPEGTTYSQAEYGTPERSHCCDQIAREAEERNDHALWEASFMPVIFGLLPIDNPPEEIVSAVDQDKKSGIRGTRY